MRNYHFTAKSHFLVTPQWSDETHKLVRKSLINALYALFEIRIEGRKLLLATPSERRVLVAFRHWYLRMRKSETISPFVYVNMNTGESIVLTVSSNKDLLVNPRFLNWEALNFKFSDLSYYA